MWDCNGLESLHDVTNIEGDAFMTGLKGETYKLPFDLGMMVIRARVTSQRSYEIYTFSTDPDVDYDCVKDMFEHSPQVIVDAVRKNGNKIYSNYSSKQPAIS